MQRQAGTWEPCLQAPAAFQFFVVVDRAVLVQLGLTVPCTHITLIVLEWWQSSFWAVGGWVLEGGNRTVVLCWCYISLHGCITVWRQSFLVAVTCLLGCGCA